jgi:hypothetical protein
MELSNPEHEVLVDHVGPDAIPLQPGEPLAGRVRGMGCVLEHSGAVSEPNDPGGDVPMIRAHSDFPALQGLHRFRVKERPLVSHQPGHDEFVGGVRLRGSGCRRGSELSDLFRIRSHRTHRSVARGGPMDPSPWVAPSPVRLEGVPAHVRVGIVYGKAKQPANLPKPLPDPNEQRVRPHGSQAAGSDLCPQTGHARARAPPSPSGAGRLIPFE